MTPVFSIITPTYNRADIVLEALESVRREQAATGVAIEQIVVDDLSSDGTEALVRGWAADHGIVGLKYIKLTRRTGVSGAKNAGIEAASGEFLLFLDSDDQLLPGALARITSQFERHPGLDLYFGSIRNKSGAIPVEQNALHDILLGYEGYLEHGLSEYLPVCRRRAIENPKLRYVEELKGFEGILWARILKRGSKMMIDSQAVRLYDDLRTDRYCHLANIRRDSERLYVGFLYYFKEFGDDLRKYAPPAYLSTLNRLIVYSKLSHLRDAATDRIIAQSLPGTPLATQLLERSPTLLIQTAYRWASQIRVWKTYGFSRGDA